MKYDDKSASFEVMMQKLVDIAKEDGVITHSEATLLKEIQQSVDIFQAEVDKAQTDGIITDAEYLMLKNIENEFLQKTFNLIERGDKLDEDNKKLVESVFNSLMKIL